jgi:hypothetical protein
MSEREENWDELFAKIRQVIREWRADNPAATLTEIEDKVDNELAEVRVELVTELAQEGKTQDLRALPVGARPPCPACGGKTVANGRGSRRLVTTYEKEIALERSRAYCPHCQVSFFPPG